MKAYIGVKIVQAEPCTLGDYNARSKGPITVRAGAEAAPGYLVTYPDGYQSWSPADVFDGAYRLISDGEHALCGVTVVTPAPSTFMSRLIAEHNELEDRLTKLNNFIGGNPTFQAFPIAQQELMYSQRGAMTQYLESLHRRMILLAPRQDHDAGDRDEILETRITRGGSDENPVPFKDPPYTSADRVRDEFERD